MRACPKQGKGFGMLSNVNQHEEILKVPKIHVNHGFEGKLNGGKKAK